MDRQAIRITIELPQGAAVQASGDVTGSTAGGVDEPAPSVAIDAGPPPSALVAALGDPGPLPTHGAGEVATAGVSSGDAIDAGAFPTRLANAMEVAGPRSPFGHPETGMIAAVLSPESRN